MKTPHPPDVATQIRGLRTVVYKVTDLAAAKKFYANVLGIAPYFEEPFYVGFNVGGFELGLDPDIDGVIPGNSVVAYWGVRDAAAAHKRLLALGATEAEPVKEVGGGIKVGMVHDPFGNCFGVIENPHFSTANVK
jgi:predicted enzyme related to lactoylglutathione lyase